VPMHSGFLVKFRAEDTKDKKEHSAPLAKELVEPLRLYLREIRSVLARGRPSPGLWITHHGKAFSADGLASDIEITTARYLGVKLNPHAFRHIAATSIAEVDPEHVGIIKDILGHATLDMAERHYNRASGISSCNALQSILEDIRKNVPRMGRAKPDRVPRRRDPRNR
ncbi:MAG: tyrosine-type recombinase/integrase, partial [Bosea sp. (in: a-proteobacteria)]